MRMCGTVKCRPTLAYRVHFDGINSPFTDFPLIKLPPETDFFLRRTHEVAPGHNTGYSYAHAHIAQIKNAREHCVHVTGHIRWRFSTMHVIKYRHCN